MVDPATLRHQAAQGIESVRRAAVRSLAWFVTSSWTAVRAVLDALRDPCPAVRAEAARALQRRDVKGKEAESALLSCLTDPSPEVRRETCTALRWVFEPTVGVPALIQRMTEDSQAEVRAEAARALAIYGRHSSLVAPALREYARATGNLPAPESPGEWSPPRRDERDTARCLASLGEVDAEVRVESISRLAFLCRNPEHGASRTPPRGADPASPGPVDEATKSVLSELQARLRDPDGRVRGAAAAAVSQVHRDPAKALEWIRPLAADADLDAKIGAVHSLRALGRDALPVLAGLTGDPDPLVRGEVAEAFGGIEAGGATKAIHLVRLLGDPSLHVCCTAVASLRWADQVGDEVVAALESRLGDELAWVRAHAACALATRGDGSSRVREVLREGRGSDDERVREACFEALWLTGATGDESAAEILKALDDTSDKVVVQAILGLGRLQTPCAAAVSRLIELLDHRDPNVRRNVVFVLGRMGPIASPAAPALLHLLDRDADSFSEVAMALASIGEAGRAAIPRVLQRLQRDPSLVPHFAIGPLTRFAAVAPEARSALIGLLHHANGQVRLGAATALTELNATPDELASLLGGLLQDSEALVRYNAARILLDVSREVEAAAAALGHLLEDEDPHVRAMAASVLAESGHGSPGLVPVLVEALKRGDPFAKQTAVSALAKLARTIPAAKETLRALANDEAGEPGLELSLALLEIGEAPDKALGIVLASLHSWRPHERTQAAWALCHLDDPSSAAIAALTGTLSDADAQVRVQAAYTLAQWGSATSESRRVLAEGIRASDAWVRDLASAGLALSRSRSSLWRVPLGFASVVSRWWRRVRRPAGRPSRL